MPAQPVSGNDQRALRKNRHLARLVVAVLVTFASAAVFATAASAAVERTAGPAFRTQSMLGSGDIADDTAVWVDPIDSTRSVLIGTNKSRDGNGGLYAFTFDGRRWGGGAWREGVNRFDNERYNSVDIRYDVAIGNQRWDIVTASNRSDREIDVFRVESDANGFVGLTKIGEIPLGNGLAPGTDAPYGLAMMQHRDSTASVFISDKDGRVAQYQLVAGSNEPVTGNRLGLWNISDGTGPVEGMVADDDRNVIYIASENRSIERFAINSRFALRPGSAVEVDRIGDALAADIEGLALYRGADGDGYLIASSQGSDSYVVYERDFDGQLANARVLEFSLNGVTNTDGIEVINIPLSDALPHGAFIAHDGEGNSPTKYAIVSWSAIARGDLLVDTEFDPRD